MKRQARDWEKIFAQHVYEKRFVSQIYKEHLKLKNKKTTQFKRWAKDLNEHPTKKDTQDEK